MRIKKAGKRKHVLHNLAKENVLEPILSLQA